MVVFIREIDISLSAFVTKTQIFACKGTVHTSISKPKPKP